MVILFNKIQIYEKKSDNIQHECDMLEISMEKVEELFLSGNAKAQTERLCFVH